MTPPNNPKTHTTRNGVTDQWRTRWLVPLLPVALGGVVLAGAGTNGHLLSGLVSFAVLAAFGALSAIAGRLEAARHGHRHAEEERETILNTRAMSIVGTVLVIALAGCAAFTLARGDSTLPYTALLAIGGISYLVALAAVRKEVS